MLSSFDPVLRSQEVEQIVMHGDSRMYYRFRLAHFYGPQGIITGDMVGCNLLCHWPNGARCWNFARNAHPEGVGQFYTPEQVALKLQKLSKKNDCQLCRISGAEVFLGESSTKHLISVIEAMPDNEFVIETNGVMLGHKPELIDLLKPLQNIALIRVCVKGLDQRSFQDVTGANHGLEYQLRAIKTIHRLNIPLSVALSQFVDLAKLKALIPYDVDFDEERISRR